MNITRRNNLSEDLFKNRWFHIAGFVLLAVAGWFLTHDLRSFLDIFFLDETGYLTRGLNMFPKIPKLWGPVYCFWYWLLHFIQSNPVDLFYLNFGLMSVLLAVALYTFLLRFKIAWPIALWLSFMVLIAPFNLTTFPKVSHFATILAMSGLMLFYYIDSKLDRYLLIALLFLILSYIRPEFYLSFMICMAGLAIWIVRDRSRFRFSLILIGFIAIASILHLGMGVPLGVETRGYNRSFVAFAEHFSWNYSKWNDLPGYLWLSWDRVIGPEFGDSKSIGEALAANPSMMFRHFFFNIGDYIKELGETTAMAMLPLKKANAVYGHIIWIVLAGLLAIKGLRNDFISRIKEQRTLFFFLILLALPSAMSSIVIYPRHHYIIIQLPLLIWLIAVLLSTIPGNMTSLKSRNGLLAILGVLIIIYFVNPRSPVDYEYFEMRKESGKLNNLNVLKLFDEHSDVLSDKSLLSHEGNFSAFTSAEFNFVNAANKGERLFSEFLEESNPDIIYCTQTIFKNPNYLDDPNWINFVEDLNEERTDWKYVSVDGGEWDFLLLRPELYQAMFTEPAN